VTEIQVFCPELLTLAFRLSQHMFIVLNLICQGIYLVVWLPLD